MNIKRGIQTVSVGFRIALALLVAYLIFSLVYTTIASCRLTTIENNATFDINNIFNISKNRITADNETYNKKELIEYNCLIDSVYYISIVRLGKISDSFSLKNINFVNKQFDSREGWFNYSLTSSSPHSLSVFIVPQMPHWIGYNVFLLPLKKIDGVDLFIKGDIQSIELVSDNTVSYVVNTTAIACSFNGIALSDLLFLLETPTSINLFFTSDSNRNLYVGFLLTPQGDKKTLKEILEGK